MRKLLRAWCFLLSCGVGVKVTLRLGEVPGAQVNLVTVAMAAVNQEPKESGEGWTSHFGEQDNTLTGGI